MFESSAQNRLINTHACPCIVATRTSLFGCFSIFLRVHAIIFQKITCMFSHAIIYWMVHIAFFLRVHAKIVSPVTRAHAYQVIVILACTRTVYPAFTCVFSKIMFDWDAQYHQCNRQNHTKTLGNLFSFYYGPILEERHTVKKYQQNTMRKC